MTSQNSSWILSEADVHEDILAVVGRLDKVKKHEQIVCLHTAKHQTTCSLLASMGNASYQFKVSIRVRVS